MNRWVLVGGIVTILGTLIAGYSPVTSWVRQRHGEPLFPRITQVWRRFRGWVGSPYQRSATFSTSVGGAFTGTIRASLQASPGEAPTDAQRLDFAVNQAVRLQQELSAAVERLEDADSKLRADARRQSEALQSEIRGVDRRLTRAITEGIPLQLVGLALVLIGAVLSLIGAAQAPPT